MHSLMKSRHFPENSITTIIIMVSVLPRGENNMQSSVYYALCIVDEQNVN